MKPEDYIGKKLSECPDGTKAVVACPQGIEWVREYRDGNAYDCSAGRTFNCSAPSTYTVHHILTLGNPRPKTLADEEEGVAWLSRGGYIRWRDGEKLMACHKSSPCRILQDANKPADICLSEQTRLDKITGIEIDGKVYRGEGGE